MSVSIKRNGTLQKIAAQTILFNANCAEIRSGTINIPAINAGTGTNISVTFSTPFSDTDYVVIVDVPDITSFKTLTVSAKTTTGFTLGAGRPYSSGSEACTVNYYAFKLVELEGYNAIYNKMINIDSTPIDNSTNLVTSGGVYDAIKNASSVFIGTASEWESESAKTDYQVAILTDQPTVNAVDSTNGTTTVVANKNLVFKGTLEEWEALTTAEKKTYDEALITNDMDTGEVVNGVTDGDMRAVTSNAVYDAIKELTDLILPNSMTHTFRGIVSATGGGSYNAVCTVPPYIVDNYNITSVNFADITGIVHLTSGISARYWNGCTISVTLGSYGTSNYENINVIVEVTLARKTS